jgi:hypothetical protein
VCEERFRAVNVFSTGATKPGGLRLRTAAKLCKKVIDISDHNLLFYVFSCIRRSTLLGVSVWFPGASHRARGFACNLFIL